MTTDEMQLLRDFRSDIPEPDDESIRRAYAYATSQPRYEGPRLSLPSVSPLRLRVVLPAAAAICAAAVALIATGTLAGGGATHTPRPTVHGDQSPGAGLFSYFHSGGALSSIAVTLNPNVANASVQLQVVHSEATSYAEADAGSTQVVFQEQVSTTTSPASSFGLSTWSGTLSPNDWSGGCQRGLYDIKWVAVGPGTSFANAASAPGNEEGASEWFSCTGS
jgi:hypothetical protein